jgi:hypothetical protein
MQAVGTRRQVWNNSAAHTSGGLFKEDLMKNKRGRIVSKKASSTASSANKLEKAGYVTQPGKFELFKKK